MFGDTAVAVIQQI